MHRWMLGACIAMSGAGLAMAEDEPPVRNFTTYQPTVRPVRINTSEAPVIDGKLDEAMWSKAAEVTEFYQVEPKVGPPSVQTRVYFAYDENNLYVGIYAQDDKPDEILASVLERDGEIWRDDMFRFYIDPFNTGTSGFGFDINALGARTERLIRYGQSPVDAWNIIWDADSIRTEDGWTAEIALPFRSLSFDPASDGWGLMMTREHAHANEEIRWAGIDQSVNKFGFARPGYIEGIQDINKGKGFDVQLQAGLNGNRRWDRPRDDDLSIEPSANISYKFTPSLTGLVTLNTDFSDTPLDDRQINTGRFSLFFPETRDFFLQDAALFEFAGQTFAGAPNGQPFFSRRIGIVNGQSVKVDAGLKLSGEIEGVEIGILSAQTGAIGNIGSQNLSVARATVDVLDQSRVGFIATNGDPTGLSDNTLAGADFSYRVPSLFGGGRMQADVFYQRTFSSTLEDDDSFGAKFDYPNDKWAWNLEARQIGEDFAPALGFVNRPGTRTFSGEWHRRFRQAGGHFRWWQFGTSHEYITDLDGNAETTVNSLVLNANTIWTDDLTFTASQNEEHINTPFFLPGGLVVPVGVYDNNGVKFRVQSSYVRPWGTTSEIEFRDFYGGESKRYDFNVNFRPNPHVDLKAGYKREDISVPAGDVSVQIGSLETVFNVSTDLSVTTQTQYDNISNSLSFFGRLNWEVRPQTEVFFALGHGAYIEGDDFRRNFRSVQTSAILRFGNTFRF
nr:sugar-binding protein [uncultured Hyphomonas sp.]